MTEKEKMKRVAIAGAAEAIKFIEKTGKTDKAIEHVTKHVDEILEEVD